MCSSDLETKTREKKKFDTLAMPPSCPEMEDDGTSPTPLQRRDPEPKRVDLTVPKDETVTKRKRETTKKSTEDDSVEKGVITKRRRGKAQPKLP